MNEEGEQKEDSDSVIQRLVDSHDNEYILSKPHEGLSQVPSRTRYTTPRAPCGGRQPVTPCTGLVYGFATLPLRPQGGTRSTVGVLPWGALERTGVRLEDTRSDLGGEGRDGISSSRWS